MFEIRRGSLQRPCLAPTAVTRAHRLFLVSDDACRVLNFSVSLKHVLLTASGGRGQGGVASERTRVCAGEGKLSDEGSVGGARRA